MFSLLRRTILSVNAKQLEQPPFKQTLIGASPITDAMSALLS